MLLALLFLFLVGAACSDKGGGRKASGDAGADSIEASNSTGKSSEKDRAEGVGVPVEVVRPSVGEISSYMLLSSTVETESRVDVYPQTTGLVEEIYVEEGNLVKKGSALLKLDDREYSIDAAKAEVSFHKLENEFKRDEKMYHDAMISVEEYENARYELKQAELEWQKAKLLLQYTRINSPIDGVVSERLVDVGDRITASTRIFSIVNLNSLIAVVHVPEREMNRVRLKQRVVIRSDYLPGGEIIGWVKRISPVVDPNSGTFKVTVGLTGDEDTIKPGMFVNVSIVTGTHEKALLVPRKAVVYDGGREYLYLAGQDSTARRVELDKGYSNNRVVEVLSGVGKEDMVVVVGQGGLKDGARVRILGTDETAGERETS